ncbi:MerR family transcriptional regulator [Mycobacterium sp. ENV421]|uniref:MerR family transcriptional regulator n=1 Tax=Mycobacterium sp. ENV421 TaxID=1213407 RepID=UPI0018EAE374|nr:MerR family transcriptional regulator [Mycobacterium sp. ENV421]
MPTTPLTRDLTIQEVSRQSGLTESALRYYERIGLIEPVPRDDSSGHRRYPPALVDAIESLSCLRSTGMSVQNMRAYVDNIRRGTAAAADSGSFSATTPDDWPTTSPGCRCARSTRPPKPSCGRRGNGVTPPLKKRLCPTSSRWERN